MADDAEIPGRSWLVALLSLPHIGPRRMNELAALGPFSETWSTIESGSVPIGLSETQRQDVVDVARSTDVAALWQRHVEFGVRVLLPNDADYPAVLEGDPEPPAALFALGDLGALDAPAIAIVGTRRCTAYGRSVATELGRDLAAAGITVVSGLALGIDAAAHAGATGVDGATPLAVVAAGLDRPAPQANRGLFRRIVESGLVVSEAPLGVTAARWRFPARNRIIAGLSQAVVVVESPITGGSMYTVDEALRRDRVVLAVPGSIRSPMSKGTNQLLADGAIPATELADVLGSIGYTAPPPSREVEPALSADARLFLDHLEYEPEMVDDIIVATGLTVGQGIAALDELIRHDLVVRAGAAVQRLRGDTNHRTSDG